MKKIIYELNEIPKKLFDFYSSAFPNSAFAILKKNANLYVTQTADVGILSPWVTWPTMHRGVSNLKHQISDLGQDLTYINEDYPNLYQILASSDYKVGVFGSLQSYPLPKNINNYSFYVPDTFAYGIECQPKYLSKFQKFNLSMVKKNGRNVKSNIDLINALDLIINSRKLGINISTYGNLIKQISMELINKDRLVRRRSSQIELSFDLFMKQLQNRKPDISFFFTNHLASSMHRYWPSIFPDDYSENQFDKDWLVRWSQEIPHAIKIANFQIKYLMNFCDKNNYQLIIASSMGQAAVNNIKPAINQILITDIKKLLRYIDINDKEWQPRMNMVPQIVIKPINNLILKKIEKLEKFLINGNKIGISKTSTGDIKIELSVYNQKRISIEYDKKNIPSDLVGISLIDLQDAARAYAYHIPEGILIDYVPERIKVNKNWTSISVLDFAPSILKSFSVKIPSYMDGSINLFKRK